MKTLPATKETEVSVDGATEIISISQTENYRTTKIEIPREMWGKICEMVAEECDEILLKKKEL